MVYSAISFYGRLLQYLSNHQGTRIYHIILFSFPGKKLGRWTTLALGLIQRDWSKSYAHFANHIGLLVKAAQLNLKWNRKERSCNSQDQVKDKKYNIVARSIINLNIKKIEKIYKIAIPCTCTCYSKEGKITTGINKRLADFTQKFGTSAYIVPLTT